MKKFLVLMMSALTAFNLLYACKGDTLPSASDSGNPQNPISSGGEEDYPLDFSTSDDFFDDDFSSIEEYFDLATSGCISSRAPEQYGTNNVYSVQSEVVSRNSTAALKGVFNSTGASVYQDYMVWTWAELRLQDYYYEPVNLKGAILTYDVKMENCGFYSSFIVVSPDGKRSKEVTFAFNDPFQTFAGITSSMSYNGWYRVTIDFSMAYTNASILNEASEILIVFSNQDCDDPNSDSIFYIDNMEIIFDSSVYP